MVECTFAAGVVGRVDGMLFWAALLPVCQGDEKRCPSYRRRRRCLPAWMEFLRLTCALAFELSRARGWEESNCSKLLRTSSRGGLRLADMKMSLITTYGKRNRVRE